MKINGGPEVHSAAAIAPGAVGLLYVPSDYVVPRKGILALWRRHLVASAAVRSADYMKALFASRFPGCVLLEITDRKISEDIVVQEQAIVLLYPDAIGMDFGWIERTLAGRYRSTPVFVLNGRRRLFRLDREMQRKLAVRRLLESSRFPEFALCLAFAMTTPFLALFDMIRGRR